MLASPFQAKVYSGTLSGLTTGCWHPEITPVDKIVPIELDADSMANHADAMRVQPGNMKTCLARQDVWRNYAQHVDTGLHVESGLTISEMIVAATKDLRNIIRGKNCVAVNSQNTRDCGYGYATAARMLFEAGCSGSSHTVSHCGVTGFYMALEHALLLGTSDFNETVVVTTGERWLNIYPRYLGKWTRFSDGAAALVAQLELRAAPNVWVLNLAVPSADFMTTIETGVVCDEVLNEISLGLGALISEAALQQETKLHMLSSAAGNRFCDDVVSALSATGQIIAPCRCQSTHNFGCADALIRLHGFLHHCQSDNLADAAYLIWDFEPNGLLGAALVLKSAFLEFPHVGQA